MLRELISEEFSNAKHYFESKRLAAINTPATPAPSATARDSHADSRWGVEAEIIRDKIDRFALLGSISQGELAITLQQVEDVPVAERRSLLQSLARRINLQNINVNSFTLN